MSFHLRLVLPMLCLGSTLRAGDGSLAERATDVLTRHCHSCHGRDGSSRGGLGAVLDRNLLVERNLVVPGKPSESELFRKVQSGEMPPGKSPRLAPTETALLKEWIEAGAPATASPPRTFVTPVDVSRFILADLESFPAGKRRFLRYVSFTHLYNAGRPDSEMALAAPGLSKLLNSLSRHPRIARPVPIDASRTVLRLDLRDYRWTARHWDRIVAVLPYRRAPIDAVERACAEATGADVFRVPGDWLLATASRGKLYYDLLDLPLTDKGLERLLDVDVARSFQEETVVRTGFNGSGVSRNNRVLERHDALHGAMWRSHDFSDNSARQNIFENPLGPVAGRHSFKPAGGEIIFHLPNGMQGYFVIDATGRRIEKAPVDIVSDPLRPDKAVEVGLSCMTCHGKGLIPKDDQVRAHVEKNAAAFPNDVVNAVKVQYAPPRRMRALLDADNKRHLAALEAAGVPVEGAEPISTLTLRYEGVVDLAGLAAELGLRGDELSKKLTASPSLQRLAGALTARGGTVQRQLIEEQFFRLADLIDSSRSSIEKTTQPRKIDVARAFEGHTDAVRAIAASPDGKRVCSAGQDHTLRLWEIDSGAMLRTFEGHDAAVNAVAFSPDGKRLISASDDRTVRLWDAETGKETARLKGHLDKVRTVVFSPDGKSALSGGNDRTLRLWDVASGSEARSLRGHAGTVHCIAFSPDGKRAVSGGNDGVLRLWDVAAGREIDRCEAHGRGVLCAAFSPNGKWIASGGEDRAVRLWRVDGLKPLRSMTSHVNAVLFVSFLDDGRRLLSGSSQTNREDRFIRLWDAGDGRELAGRGGEASVWCMTATRDGRSVLTGGSGRQLQRWSLEPEK